jgi:hypothetical protein
MVGIRRSTALFGLATPGALIGDKAFAKRAIEDWTEAAMLTALTRESLSIAADNCDESPASVRRHVREAMKLERLRRNLTGRPAVGLPGRVRLSVPIHRYFPVTIANASLKSRWYALITN